MCIRDRGKDAWTSLDQMEPEQTIYAGNLLICDDENLILRLMDATEDWCRFTVHNSQETPVITTIRPAPGFAAVYPIPEFARNVTVPAGTTVTVDVGTRPAPRPWKTRYDANAGGRAKNAGRLMPADEGAHGTVVCHSDPAVNEKGYLISNFMGADYEPAGLLKVIFRVKIHEAAPPEEVMICEGGFGAHYPWGSGGYRVVTTKDLSLIHI